MTMFRRKRAFLASKINCILEHARLSKKNVILGYGAAKFLSSGKGERSVPTTSLHVHFRRALKEMSHIRHRIELIDEFRTSMCCHQCGHVLTKIFKNKDGKKIEIRGIRLCEGECQYRYDKPLPRDRDLNAARNMLSALEAVLRGEARPMHLQRPCRSQPQIPAAS
jgi:hypothetical protein